MRNDTEPNGTACGMANARGLETIAGTIAGTCQSRADVAPSDTMHRAFHRLLKTISAGGVLLATVAGAADEAPFAIPARSLGTWAPARAPQPISIHHPRLAIRDGRLHEDERRLRLWGLSVAAPALIADALGPAARIEEWSRLGFNALRLTGLERLPDSALPALDRLVDQCARFGLRVCLVLPAPPDPFAPDAHERARAAIHRLLARINGPRGLRYADDPVIALLECGDAGWRAAAAEARLARLPPEQSAPWRRRFAAWLRRRYRDTARLRNAWGGAHADAARAPLLPAAGFGGQDRAAWHLDLHTNVHAQARLRTRLLAPAAGRVEITDGGTADWHVQLWQSGLPLRSGVVYGVRFKARADPPCEIAVGVMRAREPWSNLGLWQTARLEPAWRTFHARFTATATDPDTRLNVALGGTTGAVELAEFAVARDGFTGLRADESLDTDPGPALVTAGETEARARDRRCFLIEAETDALRALRRFIRDELACPAPLAGAPAATTADLFARRDLDVAMAIAPATEPPMCLTPAAAPLFELARRRVAGRPFAALTPAYDAPPLYGAETLPLYGAFAARQDWDIVWIPGHAEGWVALRGFAPAGHAIFMGGIAPLTARRTVLPLASFDEPADSPAPWRAILDTTWGVAFDGARLSASFTAPGDPAPDATLDWREGGPFTAAGAGAWVWAGTRQAAPATEHVAPSVILRAPGWAVIAVTAMDGRPFATSRRILVTACGRAGDDWIEPVDATVALPALGAGAWQVHVLGPDGRTRRHTPLPPQTPLVLNATDATLWWLLLRQP